MSAWSRRGCPWHTGSRRSTATAARRWRTWSRSRRSAWSRPSTATTPTHGTPFVPFAVPTIVGEIKRHFRDHIWDVHVPRRVQELRNKVRAAVKELNTGARRPFPERVGRIAEHSGLSEEDVRTGLEALESFSSLSLDAALTGADDGSRSPTPSAAPSPASTTVVATRGGQALPARAARARAQILYLRFFRDMTQCQIGEELGISQMHVSRLISRTCQEVRREVEHGRGRARRPSRGQHTGSRPGRRPVGATAPATEPARSASATA